MDLTKERSFHLRFINLEHAALDDEAPVRLPEMQGPGSLYRIRPYMSVREPQRRRSATNGWPSPEQARAPLAAVACGEDARSTPASWPHCLHSLRQNFSPVPVLP